MFALELILFAGARAGQVPVSRSLGTSLLVSHVIIISSISVNMKENGLPLGERLRTRLKRIPDAHGRPYLLPGDVQHEETHSETRLAVFCPSATAPGSPLYSASMHSRCHTFWENWTVSLWWLLVRHAYNKPTTTHFQFELRCEMSGVLTTSGAPRPRGNVGAGASAHASRNCADRIYLIRSAQLFWT